MKALTFISKHFQTIIIAALIIFILLLLKQCGDEKDRNEALAAASKSLEQKVRQDSIQRADERKVFEQEKRETEGKRQLAVIEKNEADKKVSQQQITIDRLVAVIRNDHVVDTTEMVLTSKKYKNACDSLPAEIDKLNVALSDKDSAINEWSSILAYEIQIRDEEIMKEMNYSDSLKADFNRQTALLKSALQQGKPRGKLLGGISVLGNQNQFLSGAGVVLAYQTKGGKQYQVSAKTIKLPVMPNADFLFEETVLIPILK